MRLEIIGDGEQRTELENLVKELEISDLVSFLGWQLDISPWLIRWDFFALTSLWEGLPCAVVEARLFKHPVIAYNTGGIKDVIKSNQNGMLIMQHDQKNFTKALQEILNTPDFYNKLAQYPENLDAFEIPFMVNEHIKLYKKLSH